MTGFGGAGVPTRDPFDDSTLPPTGNKDEEDAVSGFSVRRPEMQSTIERRREGQLSNFWGLFTIVTCNLGNHNFFPPSMNTKALRVKHEPLNGSCVGGDATTGAAAAAATAVAEETGVGSAKGVSRESKSTSELTV